MMGKRTDWWLEGWQLTEQLNGRGGRYAKLTYQGEYYSFGPEEKILSRLKLSFLLLTAAQTAAYLFTALGAFPSAPRVFQGFLMLAVIPVLYLAIGVGCLMPVKPLLTYRDYRGACQRIRWSSLTAAGLELASTAGEGIFSARLALGGQPVPAADLRWLLGSLACSVTALTLVFLSFRYPARLVPPELK